MVLLSLNERLLADLQILARLPTAEHIEQFCRVALEFLSNGSNKSMFKGAAKQLGVDEEAVAAGVMALTEVFIEAARASLSASELTASLADSPLTEECKRSVADFFSGVQRQLKEKIAVGLADQPPASLAGASVPNYVQLDWRLDVTLASRFALEPPRPGFTFRLDTVGGGAPEGHPADNLACPSSSSSPHSLLFSCDYTTLSRAVSVLDEAQNEGRTAHARRIARYIR